ncbi:MAG: hypothetical protein R2771_02245 [Saprospiraceae bacterium]
MEYYQKRIDELNLIQQKLSKQSNAYAFVRLIVIVLGIGLIYPLFKLSGIFGILEIILSIALFIFVFRKHDGINKAKERNDNLLKILDNEINLSSKGNIFGNGEKYKDSKHIYTSDLDIFGNYSIFNLINRTVTNEGENLLADKFKNIDFSNIGNIQSIIKELSKYDKFKEDFLLSFFIESKNNEDNKDITNWFDVFQYSFLKLKYLRPILYLISIITIATLLLGFAFPDFWTYSALLVAINFVIVIKFTQNVNKIHNHVSKQADLFKKYANIVKTINTQNFDTHYIIELQNNLKSNDNIEFQLKKLSGLIDKLDYRLNIIVGTVLNILMFWDIHYSYKIEKWMNTNSSKISGWIDTIAEFDSLLSFSILHFNNPDWIFPTISDKAVYIEAKAISHPLIKKENSITNDYKIDGKSQFDIITGSNMAGKSTFLRTIGVNTLLALNGCPVCAEGLRFRN